MTLPINIDNGKAVYGRSLMRVLRSTEDPSVNFVTPADWPDGNKPGSYFESRYVRRADHYFIAYLSSQSACNRGCKFCHLTTTGQTIGRDATVRDFINQADHVLEHYAAEVNAGRQKPARYAIFSLMARGEPLDSAIVLRTADLMMSTVGDLARNRYGLASQFSVSTIMPRRMLGRSLLEVFMSAQPTIYYSLYSMRDEFRSRWMPGAMDPRQALKILKEWQDFSKKPIVIHHPLIHRENAGVVDAIEICDALEAAELQFKLNLIRYNSPSPDHIEADPTTEGYYREVFESRFPGSTKSINRVGRDVFASCGMFVNP